MCQNAVEDLVSLAICSGNAVMVLWGYLNTPIASSHLQEAAKIITAVPAALPPCRTRLSQSSSGYLCHVRTAMTLDRRASHTVE